MKTVTISEVDAIMIQETLETAKSLSAVMDLTDSLRKLNRQNRSSPLTLSLDKAWERITSYLEGEDDGTGD